MKNSSKNVKIFNWACIALIAVILVLQFIPYWNVDGETFSIQGYIWNEPTNRVLSNYIKSFVGMDYKVGDLALTAGAHMVVSIWVAFLVLRRSTSNLTAYLSIITGVIGTIGMITEPAFQINPLWIALLVLNIVLVAVAVLRILAAKKNVVVAE